MTLGHQTNLSRFVTKLTLPPNWTIDFHYCETLNFLKMVRSSTDPLTGLPVVLGHEISLGPYFQGYDFVDEKGLLREIFYAIYQVERHEVMEWLRLDGIPAYAPHGGLDVLSG